MIDIESFPGMTQETLSALENLNISTNEQLADLKNYLAKVPEISKQLNIPSQTLEAWIYLAEKTVVNERNHIGNIPSDEYRIWVHDQVGRSLFSRVAAVTSIIGITGIVIIVSLINVLNENAIDGKINEKMEKDVEKIFKRAESDTKATVISTLTTYAKLTTELEQEVKKEITKSIGDLEKNNIIGDKIDQGLEMKLKGDVIGKHINSFLSKNDNIDAILNESLKSDKNQKAIIESTIKALGEKESTEQIFTALVKRIQGTINDENKPLAQRKNAFHLVSLFHTNADEYREICNNVIKHFSDSKEIDMFKHALESYEPSKNIENEKESLQITLNKISANKKILPDLNDSLISYILRFSDKRHLETVKNWGRKASSNDERVIAAVALSRMYRDEYYSIEQLVSLVTDESTMGSSILGINAIKEIPKNIELTDINRRALLQKLWDGIKNINKNNKDNKSEKKLKEGRFIKAFLNAIQAEDVEEMAKQYDYIKLQVSGAPRLKIKYIMENDLKRAKKYFTTTNKLARWIGLDDDLSNDFGQLDISKLMKIQDRQWLTDNVINSKIESSFDIELLDTFLASYIKRYRESDNPSKEEIKKLSATIMKLPYVLYYLNMTKILDVGLLDIKIGDLIKAYKGEKFISEGKLKTYSKYANGESFKGVKLFKRAFFDNPKQNHQELKKLLEKMALKKGTYNSLFEGVANELKFNRFRSIDEISNALIISPTNTKWLLERSYLLLKKGELENATMDLEKALPNLTEISSTYSFEAAKKGNDRLINMLNSFYKKDETDMNALDKAGALENITIFYIKNKKWQSALDITSDVQKLNKNQVWNSILRSLSASELNQNDIAKKSYEKWKSLNGRADDELFEYLGDILTSFIKQMESEKIST